MKPEQLLFAKTHEWAHVDTQAGGKVATIGISAIAVEALSDLVYIELPKVDSKVSVGQSFGEIESVKAVSDLYSPVNGEVTEVNADLAGKLEILNTDPYGAGWMVKVRMADDQGLSDLMDYATYQKQAAEEGH